MGLAVEDAALIAAGVAGGLYVLCSSVMTVLYARRKNPLQTTPAHWGWWWCAVNEPVVVDPLRRWNRRILVSEAVATVALWVGLVGLYSSASPGESKMEVAASAWLVFSGYCVLLAWLWLARAAAASTSTARRLGCLWVVFASLFGSAAATAIYSAPDEAWGYLILVHALHRSVIDGIHAVESLRADSTQPTDSVMMMNMI